FNLSIASAANPWITRDSHQSLTCLLRNHQYDVTDRASQILEGIQYIQEKAEAAVRETLQQQKEQAIARVKVKDDPVRFMREWIWFPMIYTREKNVATFINDIKTKSWADIPASHRKMTSKWQERMDCQSLEDMNQLRKFQGMIEVTFDLHGAFGNHNDLNQLQQWLKEKGCEEAFDHLFD
ncbi:hypothetical protein BX666DRAFT_1842458, partial [Dichotomocladium elegans]